MRKIGVVIEANRMYRIKCIRVNNRKSHVLIIVAIGFFALNLIRSSVGNIGSSKIAP